MFLSQTRAMMLDLGGNSPPVSVSKGSLGAGVGEPMGLGAKLHLLTFLGTSSGKCNEDRRQTHEGLAPSVNSALWLVSGLSSWALSHIPSLHEGPRVLIHSLLSPAISFSRLESHFRFGWKGGKGTKVHGTSPGQ